MPTRGGGSNLPTGPRGEGRSRMATMSRRMTSWTLNSIRPSRSRFLSDKSVAVWHLPYCQCHGCTNFLAFITKKRFGWSDGASSCSRKSSCPIKERLAHDNISSTRKRNTEGVASSPFLKTGNTRSMGP
jgi:hypothetical protein